MPRPITSPPPTLPSPSSFPSPSPSPSPSRFPPASPHPPIPPTPSSHSFQRIRIFIMRFLTFLPVLLCLFAAASMVAAQLRHQPVRQGAALPHVHHAAASSSHIVPLNRPLAVPHGESSSPRRRSRLAPQHGSTTAKRSRFLGLSSQSIALPIVPGAKVALFRFTARHTGKEAVLPVYVDEWFTGSARNKVKRVVVHVHGMLRNADVAWQNADAGRKTVKADRGSILIVAPLFLNLDDKAKYAAHGQDTGNLLVFEGNGWGEGAVNALPHPIPAVSSFEVLDQFIAFASDPANFPNIDHVTISGHSLGAQLSHRYSILGDAQTVPKSPASVSFVSMDPATYLYFTPERKGPSCAGMNDYKYGFDKIQAAFPTYGSIKRMSQKDFQSRYLNKRSAHFVNGAKDKGTGDERCAAMAQGANRTERAKNYFAHLRGLVSAKPDSDSLVQKSQTIGQGITVDWVTDATHAAAVICTSKAGASRLFIDK
ncbi:hypothetical protein ACQY0O_005324 [Thecaphora frezii]